MNEIKNTDPAVMEDKGPRGTTRWKSENGRYTAAKTVEQEDEYKDHRALKDISRFVGSEDTHILDKTVSDKLFRNTVGIAIVNMFKRHTTENEEVFFINSNRWNDIQLGIDYQVGIRTKDRTAFKNVMDIDLKTATGCLGSRKRYQNSEIKLDLYQTRVDDNGIIKNWGEGNFLNEHHQNTHFAFMIPQSNESAESIIANLKQDPNYLPVIPHAKAILVKRDQIQKYVQERILNNDSLNTLIDAYKSFKGDEFFDNPDTNPLFAQTKVFGDNNYVVTMPVPGEDFNCKVYFTNIMNTGRQQMSIRIKLPTTPFERGTIKCYFSEF